MKLSTERVLTTHVGSLPRSQLVVDMLFQRESGNYEGPHGHDIPLEKVLGIILRQELKKKSWRGVDS